MWQGVFLYRFYDEMPFEIIQPLICIFEPGKMHLYGLMYKKWPWRYTQGHFNRIYEDCVYLTRLKSSACFRSAMRDVSASVAAAKLLFSEMRTRVPGLIWLGLFSTSVLAS